MAGAGAGAGARANEADILRQISESIVGKIPPESGQKYKLLFMLNNIEYSILFDYISLENKHTMLDSPSIIINLDNNTNCYDIYFRSFIQSSRGRERLEPIKPNLPADIKPTDVFQVVSTKLKLALCPEKAIVILDEARISDNPSYISLWRMLRGEKAIYEKFGYKSCIADNLRLAAGATRLKDLPADIQTMARKLFPAKYNDEETVTDFMKKIDYSDIGYVKEQSNYSSIETRTLIDILSETLVGIRGPPSFILDKHSSEWRSFSETVKFTGWELVSSGGARKLSAKRRMPYVIVRVGSRCRVKKGGPGRPRWFSRRMLTCRRARAQQRALYAAESRDGHPYSLTSLGRKPSLAERRRRRQTQKRQRRRN